MTARQNGFFGAIPVVFSAGPGMRDGSRMNA